MVSIDSGLQESLELLVKEFYDSEGNPLDSSIDLQVSEIDVYLIATIRAIDIVCQRQRREQIAEILSYFHSCQSALEHRKERNPLSVKDAYLRGRITQCIRQIGVSLDSSVSQVLIDQITRDHLSLVILRVLMEKKSSATGDISLNELVETTGSALFFVRNALESMMVDQLVEVSFLGHERIVYLKPQGVRLCEILSSIEKEKQSDEKE